MAEDPDGLAQSAPSDVAASPSDLTQTPIGFKGFYDDGFQRLSRAAFHLGAQNLQHAEDLAQSAMLAVLENWHKIHTDPFAYARAAVRNQLIKDSRAGTRELREGLLAWGEHTDPLRASPDLTAHEDEEWVRHILKTLPAMQRAVMRLTYEGHSPAEIGAKLGVPSTNVRSNLRLARTALIKHREVRSRHRRLPPPSADTTSSGEE